MSKIERRKFLQGMAAGAAGGLMLAIRQALAADPKTLKQGIIRLSGDVAVNGKQAMEGMAVNPGDVVTTGPVGTSVYVIDTNAFLQRPNTRIEFGDTAAATFLRVVTGGLLSVFGRGRPRQLATTVATIGIRGTGCYIEADEKKSYFCLCFGSVDLSPVNGQMVSYSTTHHEKPLWIEDGKTMPATVMNHTDAEVIMLEALNGRPSPFPPKRFGRGY